MAVTIDDLPSSTALPPSYASVRLLGEISATLRAHGVRNATGFVIGAQFEADPQGQPAIAVWTGAGH